MRVCSSQVKRFPIKWLDSPFGTALLAMVWSLSDPFGSEQNQPMD